MPHKLTHSVCVCRAFNFQTLQLRIVIEYVNIFYAENANEKTTSASECWNPTQKKKKKTREREKKGKFQLHWANRMES